MRRLEPALYEMAVHGELTPEVFDAHEEALLEFCANNREQIAVLVSMSMLTQVPAAQRRRLAELEQRVEDHDREYLVACALVAETPIVRGLATAVFWLKPPVYPYRFFADRDEAMTWLREQLAAARSEQA